MNSLYTVGGLLNPSWSIGVEEQFYLLWAPAVKRLRDRLPALCWAVLAASLALCCVVHYGAFGTHQWKRFAEQLKFHYMAAGGLCAWWLHRRREGFLGAPPFASRVVQLVLFALLLDFYLTTFIHWGWLGEEVLHGVLYSSLILTVVARRRVARATPAHPRVPRPDGALLRRLLRPGLRADVPARAPLLPLVRAAVPAPEGPAFRRAPRPTGGRARAGAGAGGCGGGAGGRRDRSPLSRPRRRRRPRSNAPRRPTPAAGRPPTSARSAPTARRSAP